MPPTIEYVAAGATAATAVGTLALALSTRSLATKTTAVADASERTATAAVKEIRLLREQTEAVRVQADAAVQQTRSMRRQSEVAEAALLASVQPLLLDVPEGTLKDGVMPDPLGGGTSTFRFDRSRIQSSISREPHLTIAVRNVGQGVARVTQAVLGVPRQPRGRPELLLRGEAPTALAPGEVADLKFTNSSASETDVASLMMDNLSLVVQVEYTDIAGRQPSSLVIHLSRTPVNQGGNEYNVARIEITPAGSEEQ
jgi:hypothetical protein